MHFVKYTCQSLLICNIAMIAAGCSGETDPSAGIEPDKLAPAPENLGDNAEYAKKFGGAKKK